MLILIRARFITTEDKARLAVDEQFRKHPKAPVAIAIRSDGFEFDLQSYGYCTVFILYAKGNSHEKYN